MTKITPEDLVRYIYNETSATKAERIRVALQTDWDLRDSYEKLIISEQNLDSIELSSPRPETVNKILEYASKKRMPVS